MRWSLCGVCAWGHTATPLCPSAWFWPGSWIPASPLKCPASWHDSVVLLSRTLYKKKKMNNYKSHRLQQTKFLLHNKLNNKLSKTSGDILEFASSSPCKNINSNILLSMKLFSKLTKMFITFWIIKICVDSGTCSSIYMYLNIPCGKKKPDNQNARGWFLLRSSGSWSVGGGGGALDCCLEVIRLALISFSTFPQISPAHVAKNSTLIMRSWVQDPSCLHDS